MQVIGLDVHRSMAVVAVLDEGLTSGGRIAIAFDRDDDLLKNRPQDPLTDLGRSRGSRRRFSICSSSRATAARRSFHRRSSSPATSRLSGSMASYCRRAYSLFVARLLQCQFTLPPPFCNGPLMIGDQLECRLDRQW